MTGRAMKKPFNVAIFNESEEQLPLDAVIPRARKIYEYLSISHEKASIIFVTAEEIQRLNAEYRHQDRVTDVISFPMKYEDPEEMATGPIPDIWGQSELQTPLGDIAICVTKARQYVETLDHQRHLDCAGTGEGGAWTIVDELSFLILHGTLHLIGYDHQNDADESEMQAREREVWQALVGDKD